MRKRPVSPTIFEKPQISAVSLKTTVTLSVTCGVTLAFRRGDGRSGG